MSERRGIKAPRKRANRQTQWGVWRRIVGWGWRAAPFWTVYTGVVLIGNAVCSVL